MDLDCAREEGRWLRTVSASGTSTRIGVTGSCLGMFLSVEGGGRVDGRHCFFPLATKDSRSGVAGVEFGMLDPFEDAGRVRRGRLS